MNPNLTYGLQIADIALSALTLGALVWYTIYTRTIAKATKLNTDELTLPRVTATLIPPRRAGRPKDFLHVRIVLKNHTRYYSDAFLRVRAELDGRAIDDAGLIDGDYSGRRPWRLHSFDRVRGHYDFNATLAATEYFFETLREGNRLTVLLQLAWTRPDADEILGLTEMRWAFDFGRGMWIYEPTTLARSVPGFPPAGEPSTPSVSRRLHVAL